MRHANSSKTTVIAQAIIALPNRPLHGVILGSDHEGAQSTDAKKQKSAFTV